MANEFIIRKGYKSLSDSQITGSLSVSNAVTASFFTGSFRGDGSELTGIDGFPFTGSASISGSLTVVGPVTATQFIGNGSQLTGIEGFPYTGSAIISGSLQVTGSISTDTDATINSLTVGKGGGNLDTNTAVGYNAFSSNTGGNFNVAIGYNALASSVEGDDNVAIGYNALSSSLASMGPNTAVGRGALQNNLYGFRNTAIGNASLFSNIQGDFNTAVGNTALLNNIDGHENIAIGDGALYDNTVGDYNTGVGTFAIHSNTGGNNNTAIGHSSLYYNLTGSNNIAIGTDAGLFAGSGFTSLDSVNNSIFVGYKARALNAVGDTNEIVIGHNIVGLGSNTTVIGNNNTLSTTLKGAVSASLFSGSFVGDGSQLTGIADPTPITATIDNTDSPFTITNETIVIVDSTNGNVTVNLPDLDLIDGTPDQKPILLYKNDYSQNVIYVSPSGSQLVNGSSQDIIVSIQLAVIYNPTSAGWVTEGTSAQSLAELELFFVPRTETGSLSVATASYVEYTDVVNKPTLVSGSSQISFSGITNKPTLVSGSSQISFSGITNKPTLVSGSSQITYSGLTGIPSGIVSSSVQVKQYNVFATTGSNQFSGSQTITGSLTVTGQVVAQTLNVQQVTSSIVYSSGSNIFGNSLANTQQFTGSVGVTGSLTINGTSAVVGSGTTNYIPKFTAGSTIENSTTQTDATGNLMVGSANSGNAGTINVSVGVAGTTAGGLQLWAASNQTHYLQFGDGTTGAQVYAGYLGYAHSTDSLLFGTNGADKMTLTSSGNLGLGVTPSAWNSAYRAMQFGTTGAIFGESGDAANYFTTNTFVDSVGFKYITSDWALGYFQENGVHSWRTAPSGTAGNAISFTQAMTLDASGRLGIGAPTPLSKLHTVGPSTAIDNSGIMQISTGTVFSSNKLIFGINDGNYAWIQAIHPDVAYRSLTLQPGGGNLLVGTTSNNGVKFQVAGGATFTGDVGIGVIPTSKFEIQGSTSSPQFRISRSEQTNQGLTVQAGGGVTVFNSYDGTDTVFGSYTFNSTKGSTTVERMRVTTDAITTVEIVGATANNDNYPRLRFKGGTYPDADSKYPYIQLGNGGLALNLNSGTSTTFNNPAQISLNNGTIFFSTAAATSSPVSRMEISSLGYVTTDPNSATNGGLIARGIEYSFKSVGSLTGYTQGAIVVSSGTDSTPSARGQGIFYFNEGNDITWYNGGLYNATDRWDICRKTGTSAIDASTAQTAYTLFNLNSSGAAYNATGTWGTISSDQRLKENIVDATSKLDDVMSLKVRNFNYIGKEEKYIGFIAQELEQVFPSLVTTNDMREFDRDGNVISGLEDTKGVKVGMDFAILVKAIQEQQTQIEILKAEIQTLKQ